MYVYRCSALVLPALLCLAASPLFAQSNVTERQADFVMRWQGDELQFKPVIPALAPIAVAPAAYNGPNLPIITDNAPARSKKQWSPGFMAGWTHIRPARPNNRDQPYYSLGFSLSSIKPDKPFYQAEIWGGRSIRPKLSTTQSSDTLSSLRDIPGLPFWANVDSVSTRIRDTEFSALYFHIVPLQLRKTVKPWLALGGGLALDFNILESKADAIIVTERFVYDREGNTTLPDFYERSEARDPFNFDELTFSFESRLFADVQLGQVEQGLSLTLRLYFNSILFDGELLSTEIPVWTNLFLAWRL